MSADEFEKKIDKFIEEECDKDITQSDKIDDEQVEQALGEMGWVWDIVRNKLENDAICFNCKKDIDISKDKFMVRQASKIDKGAVAFVGICKECIDKLESNEVNKNE